MSHRKNKDPVIVETLRILVGQVICLALMLAVYALIGKFSVSVLAGGIVGTVLSVGNFFLLAVSLSNMTDSANEARVRLRSQGSYLLRTVAMLGIAFVAVKFGGCDVIATVLPLFFSRPILMVEQFVLRSSPKSVAMNAKAEAECGDTENSEEEEDDAHES